MSQPQGHSAIGRIMSMKNSNDTIENRARDLPACRAETQPTAPPRVAVEQLVELVVHKVRLRIEKFK